MQGHVTEEQLTALAEECLADREKTVVEEHVQQCEWCREQLSQIGEVRLRLTASAQGLELSSIEDAVLSRIERERQTREGRMTAWSRSIHLIRQVCAGTAFRAASISAVLIVIVVLVGVFYSEPSQAWSLEQSIEAVQEKRGVHFAGSLTIEGSRVECQMWVRGRQGESRMQDMLLRAENGTTVWVSGNATYVYIPPEPVVYKDDAQTAGFTHWPGAAFLQLLQKIARNAEVDYRFDLFAARRLVVLKAQLVDVGGPKSFVLEFDPSSKLLVRLKSWNNYDWSGPPTFQADSVTYLDSAPDSLFHVELPDGVVYRDREVSVAAETIGLLTTPSSGLSLPGLTEEEASRKIVEGVYTAEISGDLAGFRRLAPLASLWDDEQLRTLLAGTDGQESVIEVVEVGEPRRRGRSSLGPLIVVPVVVRHKEGSLYEHKIIVQIRHGAGRDFSCVVYGPYGVPYPVE
ncbi:MAG: hypothetical protein EHM23_07605 [Acidobacteria bacterium]|nr:MAG: hypothetical protein EHM23_07605 [Acidobacteriota bacterium]